MFYRGNISTRWRKKYLLLWFSSHRNETIRKRQIENFQTCHQFRQIASVSKAFQNRMVWKKLEILDLSAVWLSLDSFALPSVSLSIPVMMDQNWPIHLVPFFLKAEKKTPRSNAEQQNGFHFKVRPWQKEFHDSWVTDSCLVFWFSLLDDWYFDRCPPSLLWGRFNFYRRLFHRENCWEKVFCALAEAGFDPTSYLEFSLFDKTRSYRSVQKVLENSSTSVSSQSLSSRFPEKFHGLQLVLWATAADIHRL